MRVFLLLFLCLAFLLAGGCALADAEDLSGGVFIAHAPPTLQYTTSPQSGSWCTEYSEYYAISSCESQDNEIDSQGMAVWYVLCAWEEGKEWCGTEFGLGDYDEESFLILEHGPCFPGAGLTIPTDGWPGPNEGIALATTDTAWSGNFRPVYWMAGHVYAEDVIPLSADPAQGFGGWARCGDQQEFEALDLGGMGLLTDGIYACPEGGLDGDGDIAEEDAAGGDIVEGGGFDGDGLEVVCCVGECCHFVTEEECANLGGTVHPEYVDCTDNPCSTWHPPGNGIYVEPDGSGDYATIQDAVCAAHDGDIIWLMDGVFTGPGNRDIDLLGKAVTVRSYSWSAAACTLDCQGSELTPHRAFNIERGEGADTRLEYMTIANGFAAGGFG